MKDFHVVFEGFNQFQKEETLQFEQDYPPPSYYMRDYQVISLHPFGMFNPSVPAGDELRIKERCFRLRARFYALGKNIAYYTEER